MRWRDFSSAPGVGPWQGLDFEAAPENLAPGAPGLRVEGATPGRLRIVCGGAPALWARIHRYHCGLWRLIAARSASWQVVPPLHAADVAAVEAAPGCEAWWKAWARQAARALCASPRGPLHAGRWALTAAAAADLPGPRVPGASPAQGSQMERVKSVRDALDAPALAWESWWLNGSGGLLRMREPSAADAGRVRAWSKRAREGTLPPALVLWVSGLDMFLLLDGHDRVRAAALEGAAPGFLVLWRVRETQRLPDTTRQEAVVRELERKRELAGGRRPLTVAMEKRLLVDAFDDRPWLWPRTRAYPLAGGAVAWDEEVARQPGVPSAHAIFSGEPPPET